MPPGDKPYWGPGNLPDFPDGSLLIVRHSERYPVITAQDAFTAVLTDNGKHMAREFGGQLGQAWRGRIGAAVASPVLRCVQTAEEILNGALDGRVPHPAVQPLPALHFEQRQTGLPGLAEVYLNDPGFLKLVSNQAAPEYALMRRSLLETLPFPSEPGVLHLGVTHDVVVTFLQTALLGLPSANLADFPGFLQGVCLVKQNGAVHLF